MGCGEKAGKWAHSECGEKHSEETQMQGNRRQGSRELFVRPWQEGDVEKEKGNEAVSTARRKRRKHRLDSGLAEVGPQRTEALQFSQGGHCSPVSCHSQTAALLTQTFSLAVLQGSQKQAEREVSYSGQLLTRTSSGQGCLS